MSDKKPWDIAGPGRPSDLKVEMLIAGELSDAEGAALRETLEDSDGPQLADRSGGWAAHDEMNPNGLYRCMLMKAKARAPVPAWKRVTDWLLPPRGAGALVAALGIVIGVVSRLPGLPTSTPFDGRGDTRAKGAVGPRMFAEREGISRELLSGETLDAADQLQFTVDLKEAGPRLPL